ncbi:Nucleoside-diphosphate-sugar epimerase [Devosia enhydra]|uniref:Nucleoside-diphosphate-sugar epimerase n=1 Tax=Devosia enhydra TaxID=665118 RepID=A0A1K2I487_9HYPH|nr:SDR family oxidoreductase [Devosia enhydra]SFZ86548.1 Nucleoside-diphosphate-sugar epimerase [Devosia enhydra]
MKLMVFGLGFSARAAVKALREQVGDALSVVATQRQPDRDRDGDTQLLAFSGPPASAHVTEAVAVATHILVSAPPGADGDPVLRALSDVIATAPRLQWLCYYSTVGVYGDHQGAWIDESAPTAPVNPRSAWRVAAEAGWQELAAKRGVPLTILRLAGIYGPGRSGFDKLRAGTARRIIKPGQVFNRIHVADIGTVTALAAERRLAGLFNLADDLPAPPQDVVAHAAGLIGLAPPPEMPFDLAEMTPMARSFYSDNKRVSNAAIKRALGLELAFPTYREGLADILARESAGSVGDE